MQQVLILAISFFGMVHSKGDPYVPQWFKDDCKHQLPKASRDDWGKVHFDIPGIIEEQLLQSPTEYLQGSCLQTFQGYNDGTRMDNLISTLGSETKDFMVDFMLFDFLSNDCNWVSRWWGETIEGWQYVLEEDTGILKRIGVDFGFLSGEMQSWYAWWMSAHPSLCSDTILAWKTDIARQFLSLKSSGDLTISPPVTDVADSEQCSAINPVLHFGPLWRGIAKKLNLWRAIDTTGHHSGGAGGAPATSIYRINIPVVVCVGVCIHVGAGLTWDFREEVPQIHWSYGVGDHVSVTSHTNTPAHLKFQLQVFCNDIEDVTTVYGPNLAFGQLLNNRNQNLEYHVLYSAEHKLTGISFGKPWGGTFDEGYSHTFTHGNSGPIARLVSHHPGLTFEPSYEPTATPTRHGEGKPTPSPTNRVWNRPSDSPTPSPTNRVWRTPTARPSKNPTYRPTPHPTNHPSTRPTRGPTERPTLKPTERPTSWSRPTHRPTYRPSERPTAKPTERTWNRSPTHRPTERPSYHSPKSSESHDHSHGHGWGHSSDSDHGWGRWGKSSDSEDKSDGGWPWWKNSGDSDSHGHSHGHGHDSSGDSSDGKGWSWGKWKHSSDESELFGNGCGNTFIYSDQDTSTCFLDMEEISEGHWGWALEIHDGQTLTGDIIGEAEGCDLEAGKKMGTFSVSLDRCTLDIHYETYPGVTYYTQLHVQYGHEPYARQNDEITINPDAYRHVYSSDDDSPKESFHETYTDACDRRISPKSGEAVLYVLLHGVGCFYAQSDKAVTGHKPHTSSKAWFTSYLMIALCGFAILAMIWKLRSHWQQKSLGENAPLLGSGKALVNETRGGYQLLP